MVGYIPVIPLTRRQRLPQFLERIQQSHLPAAPGGTGPRAMLHYDSRVGDLRPYLWPVNNGQRVTPDELASHRLSHHFLSPCCLCAWLEAGTYTEATIGLAQMIMDPNSKYAAEYLGHYVAICAEQKCGYFVIVEHFYTHYVLPVKQYLRRDKPLKVADPFLFMTDDTEETARRSGLRQILILGDNDDTASSGLRGSRKLLQRQDPHHFTEMEDDMEKLMTHGLPAEKFWDLFVQCTQCKVVMPRHYYPYSHPCAVKVFQGTMDRYKATFKALQRRLKAEEDEIRNRAADEAGSDEDLVETGAGTPSEELSEHDSDSETNDEYSADDESDPAPEDGAPEDEDEDLVNFNFSDSSLPDITEILAV